MTPKNARAHAAAEAKRGQEALAEAKHLLNGGFFNAVVSRAYYAAFHFARALLFLKGMEPKTHQGLIQLVSLQYVKAGVLKQGDADLLPRLETSRELSDYNSAAGFTQAEAEKKIREAESFIAACSKILANEGVRTPNSSVSRSARSPQRSSKGRQSRR